MRKLSEIWGATQITEKNGRSTSGVNPRIHSIWSRKSNDTHRVSDPETSITRAQPVLQKSRIRWSSQEALSFRWGHGPLFPLPGYGPGCAYWKWTAFRGAADDFAWHGLPEGHALRSSRIWLCVVRLIQQFWMSACLSLCLCHPVSLSLVHCSHMAEDIVRFLVRPGRPITLAFWPLAPVPLWCYCAAFRH